jgi:hypothetical protein
MKSKLERDFPWLAIGVLASHAAFSGLAQSRDESLAHYERAIANCLITRLCREYRTNEAFATYLQTSRAALARDSMQVWLNHAMPAAFEHVTGLDALKNNILD